ncbi:SurA N-terminal domain-containing protein [Shewanella algae]|uniref:SurA N-terminal domain-containing protein n=1 Tax=Shewanella algae TaxID=38313 RepID=UPI0006D24846|nr:SurA N-terminal domain-containing protein [Shewanella algae]PSS74861.1 peptidylprolyl isomerase [Shewanella algae]
MLEKIREGSQGVIAKGILVLVILSFAFAGVSSYLGSSSVAPAATVNGEEISTTELDQAYQSERARLEQQLGEMFDALAANDAYLASIKKGVLERLVAQKLLDQAAAEMGLRVSNTQIIEAIRQEPAFQTEGKFDNDRFEAILRQLGYQQAAFRESMRVDMTRRQLISALIGSEFVLNGEAESLAKLQGQTRDIRYLLVDAEPFLGQATVTEEEAKSFYDTNPAQFERPEMVSLEYVELNAKDLVYGIKVSDELAKTYYDEHQNQYQTAEKRLAAHILIDASTDNAEAKAEDIHKQLENGADFAALAKSDSQDTSGEKGGELGWFEPGVMDPAFDEALFALNKGDISKVVKTPFGFHIIKLLDIQSGQTAPFAEVKDKIVEQIKQEEAVKQFYGLQQKLADTSYEIPDNLQEAAKAVGAEIKTTRLFGRDNAPAPFDKPELSKAAFSSDVLGGMNSELLEVDRNHVVVVRVKEHQQAGTLEFAEVKPAIEARLKQQKANEIARDKAQEYMVKLKEGNADIALQSRANLGRFTQDVDSALVSKAFQMAKAKEGLSVDTVSLATGYAVVVLDAIHDTESAPADQVAAIKQRLNSQFGENDYRAVIDMLKAKAEIIYPEGDE